MHLADQLDCVVAAFKAADEARAEVKRKAQAIWAEHQAIIDRLAAEAEHAKANRIPAVEPRIRGL